MNAPHNPARQALSLNALYAGFLAILPQIESHDRIYFRRVRYPHRREDTVAEMVAIGWR